MSYLGQDLSLAAQPKRHSQTSSPALETANSALCPLCASERGPGSTVGRRAMLPAVAGTEELHRNYLH